MVNSSIILVDYINVRRRAGESREEAILHACPLRVRPVLMTTLTTVLAMVPMAVGWGNTNEMMSDMGVAMMSGMIISTVVTLVFTPVFYSVIDNIPRLFRRRRRRPPMSGPSGAPDDARGTPPSYGPVPPAAASPVYETEPLPAEGGPLL